MTHIKRFLALALTLALLLGTAACGDETTESSDVPNEESVAELSSESAISENSETESSQEESSEPPPPPEPTAAEVFINAVSRWEEADSYTMDFELESHRFVGSITHTDKTEYKLEYVGVGTDSFGARVSGTKTVLDNALAFEEIYADGTAYFSFDGDGNAASCALSADAYASRYVPAVMITPELYADIHYEGVDDSIIAFGDAVDFEEWLYSDDFVLTAAGGSATLNNDGTIDTMQYWAEYHNGPVYFYDFYTVTLSEGTLTADELVPPSEKQIHALENIDLPMLLTYATVMTDSVLPGAGWASEILQSTALGVTYYDDMTFDRYDEDGVGPFLKVTEDYAMYASDFTDELTWEGTYLNGAITYTENGKPIKNHDVDLDFLWGLMYDCVYSMSQTLLYDMEDLVITDIGDFLILEFNLPDTFAAEYESFALGLVLNDPTFLEQNGFVFEATSFSGMLSIDKATGYITAESYALTGTHSIDGESYDFTFCRDLFYEIGSIAAYQNITGEVYPDIEPAEEEKATPAFYEITDENGNKLYLLGTVHVGDDRTAYLPDEIYAALNEADALAVEMNLNTLEDRLLSDQELYDAYLESYFYQDGTTLADHVGKELYEDARKRLFACGNAAYAELCRPTAVDTFYSQYLLESCGVLFYGKGVDQRLLDLADEIEKKVYEIENVKDHLLTYNYMSEDTQRMFLEFLPEYNRIYTFSDTLWLYDLWCAGDVEGLKQYMSEEFPEDIELTDAEKAFYEEYQYYLATRRDEIMFEAIKDYLASGETVFVAVGCAHVLGEGALIDMLEDANYTVTLVEYR